MPEPLLNRLEAAQSIILTKLDTLVTDLAATNLFMSRVQAASSSSASFSTPAPATRTPNLEDYRNKVREAAAIFAQLTTRESVRTFPSYSTAAFVAVSGVYFGRYFPLVKQALANERAFTPPLGLPQSVFTGFVIGFAALFCVLVLGLFYAGYIAKPKNQSAANAVSHLVTFLSGALLGIKS